MQVNLERTVVILSLNGEAYIGDLPMTLPRTLNSGANINEKVTPERYMHACYTNGEPIELLNARVVMAQRGVRMSPPTSSGQQRILGVESMTMLTPIYLSNGPVEKIYTTASSWIFPKDNEHTAAGYSDLLVKAGEEEKRASAARVLDLSTTMPPGIKR